MNDRSPTPSLIDRLEQDLTEHTQASAAEEIAVLREILQKNPEPQPSVSVYEHPILLPFLYLLIAVGIGYGVYTVGLEAVMATPRSMALWGAGVALVVFGIYKFVYKAITHWNIPMFTLSLDGIQFRGVAHHVPWLALDDFESTRMSVWFSTVRDTLEFNLNREHVLQWPKRQPSRYLKYIKRKARITVMVFGSSVSPEKLSDHIAAYRINAAIRARLAELGESTR